MVMNFVTTGNALASVMVCTPPPGIARGGTRARHHGAGAAPARPHSPRRRAALALPHPPPAGSAGPPPAPLSARLEPQPAQGRLPQGADPPSALQEAPPQTGIVC